MTVFLAESGEFFHPYFHNRLQGSPIDAHRFQPLNPLKIQRAFFPAIASLKNPIIQVVLFGGFARGLGDEESGGGDFASGFLYLFE
ncbi:MAG: hypothetical protein WC076_10075 [Terrimicrobiaceae bacterium]